MGQPVPFKESSNIEAAEYDVDSQQLTVKFKSGGTYTYDGVSQEKVDAFSQADSAGKYLNTFIKGQHLHTKNG